MVAQAQPVLVGQNLFQIEVHLKRGLMNWGAIEEAMWDAIGKIAGEPVSRLLGGASLPTVPVYITYVWPGTNGQETITPQFQAEQAKLVKAAGFNAMKIQIFRRDYNVDVQACAEILAVGGSGFRVMVDRTADRSPTGLWTYDQALAAARALEKVGCYWLEEPLARDDYDGPARLRRESKIIITGGEGYHGLEPYKQCMIHGTYDILQPELRQVAGIFTARKVGVLTEAWGLKTAPHGTSGTGLGGSYPSVRGDGFGLSGNRRAGAALHAATTIARRSCPCCTASSPSNTSTANAWCRNIRAGARNR